MNANSKSEKFEIRETIDGVPVKFFVYPAGARIGNHAHSFMSPAESYTFFVVGEIDTTGMTDAEFFSSPFAAFEGVSWTGYTTDEATYEFVLHQLRKEARRDIGRRLTYTAKLEIESIAQAAQIEALEARLHETRQTLCYTYGYLEFNLDTERASVRKLLNRIYDTVGTLNADYFYDVVEYELLPAGDAGMFPAAHPRPMLDEDYAVHLDTCALTHAIQDQASIRHFAAAHLAAVAVQDGYSGGAVVAGVGDYGLSEALYTVIYQARGQWQVWCGYFAAGKWHTVDCAQHRDLKAMRWMLAFNHNARLCDVVPAEVAVQA